MSATFHWLFGLISTDRCMCCSARSNDAPVQADLREQRVTGALAVVEFDGALRERVRLVEQRGRRARIVAPLLALHRREQRVGHAVPGIEFDGLLEQPRRLGRARRIVPGERVALQHALVGIEARRRLAARALDVRDLHAADERAHDRLHDLVLHVEDLGLRPVEPLAPDVAAGLGVDQLHADADAIADAAHRALDDEAHVQFARDLRGVDGGPAIPERGRARSHGQQPPARELGDDVRGDAVAEVLLLRVAAQVGEAAARRWRCAAAPRRAPGSGPARSARP